MPVTNEHIWDELLPNYLEGRLDSQEQQALEAWLEAAPENRQQFEQVVLLWHQAKEVDSRLTPEASLAEWKKKHAQPPASMKLHRKTWMAVAASVAILLSLGYWFITSKQPFQQTFARVTIQDSLRMEDGSMIYSNGSATIEYPEHFANNSREINQLQGVAFFEITKNPKRPFIIHNRVASIKVVGTSFQTRMDSDRAEVIVRTGKVIVFNKEEQVALLPGEKVIFYSSGKKAVMQTNEDMNYLFWKTNLLEYDNISLQKVCEDIEQKFDCRIELPNTLQTKIVHGRYFAEDLPQLLNTLSETFNSTYTTQGRNVKFLLK